MSTFSAFVIDGIAALGATGLLLTFAAPPGGVSHPSIAPSPLAEVTLTAQAQPLPVQLFNEQIAFNVSLAVNFVTTGAALAQRIAQIPGRLVSDVRNGTPLPTAIAGALTAFADIEFQAGRDLLGYGRDIANFQIQFLTHVLSALSPFASGPGRRVVTAAVTQPTKSNALQRHFTITGPLGTAPSHHEPETSEGANQHSHHLRPVDAAHVHEISQTIHQGTHAKGTRTHRH
jgi:hypothetical protein